MDPAWVRSSEVEDPEDPAWNPLTGVEDPEEPLPSLNLKWVFRPHYGWLLEAHPV